MNLILRTIFLSILVAFMLCSAAYSASELRLSGGECAELEPTYTTWGEDPDETINIETALITSAVCVGTCDVTYYDSCEICCGKSDGITYTGDGVVPYLTVAVDPTVIPLLSDVYIEFADGTSGWYYATDIGSGISGKAVDIAVQTHDEALRLGRTVATVYYVPPTEN